MLLPIIALVIAGTLQVGVLISDQLALNQGTIYPALLRLDQKGWIKSEWGTSENNRRARFYGITRAGRKQLQSETDSWTRTVAMMNRLLEGQPEGQS